MSRSPRQLLRFWLTFEEGVGRRDYSTHGFALMALKYAVDATLVGLATSTFWTPVEYLQPVSFILRSRLSGAPGWLAPVMAIWTLPFLWIGVTMTIRRLLDVGMSAWWSLLFFVPFMSYGVMLILALVPGSARPARGGAVRVGGGDRLPSALMAMAIGAMVGLVAVWLAAVRLNSYGMALFMGFPFAVGVVTAFAFCRRYPASTRETLEVVTMTMLLVAGAALAVGFEGAVCLLMAAPLGIVVAMMGAVIGRFLASIGESPARGAMMIGLLLPGGIVAEAGPHQAALREVQSAVVIDASPDAVWPEVIAFSPIPAPTSILFRLGLAYPTHAEIEGAGVDAVRYCVFSTGTFVEPITAWEPGKRLAFDVAESPPPMKELSFFDIAPPHLDGYLLSRAGEFRLIALPDGRTRLEGSTWYEQRLQPEGYWVLFSDYIIERIHRRVLDHIKAEVERGTTR